MEGSHEAEGLLDAALTLLNRQGAFRHLPGITTVSATSGNLALTMRGRTRLLPDERHVRRPRFQVVREGPSYRLEVRAPRHVLSIGWGEGNPIEVFRLVRGDWERELMAVASIRPEVDDDPNS